MANKTEEEFQDLMKEFREWLTSQPHLPKDVSDMMVRRFIHSCYYDLEKAKTAAELFFTLRGSSPDLTTNRDPLSSQMQKYFKCANLAQLQISGNRNLWLWQLNDPGMENFDYLLDAKTFILSTDAWFLEDERLEDADIVVLDVKDVSLRIITKFNMSIAKRIAKYQEEAIPIRLKEVHIVNAPSFIDKIFALIKPLLKQELTNMIHFHPPKSESLFKCLNKEDLPEDFGGTNGKMDDHMNDVLKVIMKHRDQLNGDLWRAEDKKSIKKKEKEKAKKDKKNGEEKENGNSIEVNSFRNLAID